MNVSLCKQKLQAGQLDEQLLAFYSETALGYQKQRYLRVMDSFLERFGDKAEMLCCSAPGRTEIGGNHTDHNNGCVLAASVDLDAIAVAAKNDEGIVRVKSEGYRMDVVDVHDLGAVPAEVGKSAALVRGVLAGFAARGYNIGGFDATTASDVLSGSGLSSSAAFEILVSTLVNHLYNDGKVSPVEMALISQSAENAYFGKPSGLLDQTASAVGSCVTIDFKNPADPKIEQVQLDLHSYGYALCVTDTGGNHANLTDEYTAIRREMEAVAQQLGKQVLREADEVQFRRQMPQIRAALGDRPVLRALHFYNENRRVATQVQAIHAGDFPRFLQATIASGQSSFMYNQNIYSNKSVNEQPVAIGLALSEELLRGTGAWRVQGGGFAGTIQAFVPLELLEEYKTRMQHVFGEKACYVLQIRPLGGVRTL